MKFTSTYVPRHRGPNTQKFVRVWEIARALGVSSREVVATLREYQYEGMIMSPSTRVNLPTAVGVASIMGGDSE